MNMNEFNNKVSYLVRSMWDKHKQFLIKEELQSYEGEEDKKIKIVEQEINVMLILEYLKSARKYEKSTPPARAGEKTEALNKFIQLALIGLICFSLGLYVGNSRAAKNPIIAEIDKGLESYSQPDITLQKQKGN